MSRNILSQSDNYVPSYNYKDIKKIIFRNETGEEEDSFSKEKAEEDDLINAIQSKTILSL